MLMTQPNRYSKQVNSLETLVEDVFVPLLARLSPRSWHIKAFGKGVEEHDLAFGQDGFSVG